MESLTDLQRNLLDYRRNLYKPTPVQTVVEWSEANLRLTARQTEHPGPFSTSVRPYTREPMECWKDTSVSEVTLCWGSQTSKTTTLMAGLAWLIANEPSPALWLMPTENLARSFSKSRWLPMLEDSPAMLECFPAEADKITNLEQNFTRSTLTFVGSNSPANLASRPVRVLIADEVDKFAEATAKEADALDLAEQRLKSFSSSKAFMTSTPTVVEGRIWQRFLRGDQRRFYLPCPHCKEYIRLEWRQVTWEDHKTEDGKHDLSKIRASAHYVCQLCQGKITVRCPACAPTIFPASTVPTGNALGATSLYRSLRPSSRWVGFRDSSTAIWPSPGSSRTCSRNGPRHRRRSPLTAAAAT
jgi:phage terminase large subunit GpA-like protein